MTVRGGMRSRRGALVLGVVIVAMYVAFAAWSGHLSPLAKGPLLDGLAPANYRWVNPPPELASTNEQPSAGEFPLDMGPKGIEGAVVFTSDNQVTVIVIDGSIAPKAGQDGVDLTVTPLDPATLPAPGDGLSVFGNAYAIDATYRPSGDPVRTADMSEPFDIILVYPSLTTMHASTHQLAYSADGADLATDRQQRQPDRPTGRSERARRRHGDGRRRGIADATTHRRRWIVDPGHIAARGCRDACCCWVSRC